MKPDPFSFLLFLPYEPYVWPSNNDAALKAFVKSIQENKLVCDSLSAALGGANVCGAITSMTKCLGTLGNTGNTVKDLIGTVYFQGEAVFSAFMGGVVKAFEKFNDLKFVLNFFKDGLLQWVGLQNVEEAFGKVLETVMSFVLGTGAKLEDLASKGLQAALKFFDINENTPTNLLKTLGVPEPLAILIGGSLTKLVTDGPEKAYEFLKDTVADQWTEAQKHVTEFLTDLPNTIKEQVVTIFTDMLKTKIPALIGDIVGMIAVPGLPLVAKAVTVIELVGKGCAKFQDFIKSMADAFTEAARDPAGAAVAVMNGILGGLKSAVVAAIQFVASWAKLGDLPEIIKNARNKVIELLTAALKKVIDSIRGFLKKQTPGGEGNESSTLEYKGKGHLPDGTEVEVKTYVGKDGKIHLKWNPDTTLEAVDKNNPGKEIETPPAIKAYIAETDPKAKAALLPAATKALKDLVSAAGVGKSGFMLCDPKGSCFAAGTVV